jgi:hypothetical protein
MNLEQIENNIKELVSNLDKENFIYDFLLAYGLPKSSINRLKKVIIINLKMMVRLFGLKKFTLKQY